MCGSYPSQADWLLKRLRVQMTFPGTASEPADRGRRSAVSFPDSHKIGAEKPESKGPSYAPALAVPP